MEVKKSISSFTDLHVWQEGHTLVLMIYRLTRNLPKEELYSLTDQMKRAVTSITNNIAEGFGRKTYKDKVYFYYLAFGSVNEIQNQLLICRDLTYISSKDYEEIIQQQIIVSKLLQGIIKKTKSFI